MVIPSEVLLLDLFQNRGEVMVIYQIKNKINGKLYIGQTSDFEKRLRQHQNSIKYPKVKMPIKYAIIKYGWENFEAKILETCTQDKIDKQEIHWIKTLNSRQPNGYNLKIGGESNSGDSNPRSKVSQEDVFYIREIYASKTATVTELYDKNFREKISFSAFEKIWQGVTWREVNMEVYTEANKNFHNTNSKSRKGDQNSNGIFNDEQVMYYRQLYIQFTAKYIYENYCKQKIGFDAFWCMLRGSSYKHIPRYNKVKKQWIN